MIRLLFALSVIFQSTFLYAQKHTVSGTIRDGGNGETLIGATVTVKELPKVGAITNPYGFYSLTLPAGDYTFQFSFVGFENQEKKITLQGNQTLNVELNEGGITTEEVEIVAKKAEDERVASISMSKEELKIEQVKVIPAVFGEIDVIKTLTLLPGVQNASEGTSGLFVRGGANDQNLILLDDAPVYNASHLLGFFSVFNPDAVKDVQLYKGGIPSRFGGRLSSIVDIRMREGNSKKMQLSGGIGSIASRLTLEGPLIKDKASFMLSGRRTYADVFLNFSNDPDIRNNTLYFYDFNAKANYRISDKDRLFVSGYFGRDVFNFDDVFGLNWGNATATLRWNHIFSQKLFLNTTFIFSNFDYGFDIKDGSQNFQWRSSLRDYEVKTDFTYFLNPQNTITFGMTQILHRFRPATIRPIDDSSIFIELALDDTYAWENAFYIGNEQEISPALSVEYGLRYSTFQNVGKGTEYIYAEGAELSDNAIVDTVQFSGLSLRNFYHGLEPRLGMRYRVRDDISLKASYNRTRQYIQIASPSTAGLPFDRWVPTQRYLEPQIGDQVALGYFQNFRDNQFEFSAEVYYKWMQNQFDVKDGGDILLNNNVEDALLAGEAWSYGLELMLRKNIGRTSGWVSYTWSKTQRRIPGINGGLAYSPRYDRRHDVSFVLTHQFNERMTLGATWVYATGAAVSFPVGKYEIEGRQIEYYDPLDRNGDRMPAYHRFDVSLTIDGKNKKNRAWQGSWNFSIYNLYNRKNPFSIYFRENENNASQTEAVQTTLFGIIPSVTYNFRLVGKK
ncbi:MAG: carboxypeptidase-like regulatory domain-containing protein [Bernardetiaceae bacterium]